MKKVLIVDDDVAVTNYFMVFLMQTERFDSTVVNDSRKVEKLLETQSFDVIMLDLDMPNVSGIDVLNMMQAKEISIPVIVLTGANDVDLAVRSMKRGAFDYLTKPVDDEHLIEVLDNAIEHGAVLENIGRLPADMEQGELKHSDALTHLPTTNPEMILLLRNAEKVAKCDLSIFIWGEQGTGKESLAKAIHQSSLRAGGPFVAVDCTAHTREEFSSELFGRAKDWSGKHDEKLGFVEAAAGGTLFIDNIDYLGLPVQVRLKRVIQNSEYYRDNSTEIKKSNVRIIVSSTKDLTSSRYRETFSRDLLYHLMINSMKIPPLRSRREDIPLIIDHFLQQELKKLGRNINSLSVSNNLLDLLIHYSYPDNVQELQNIIACAVVGAEEAEITPDDLSPYIRERITPGSNTGDFTPAVLQNVIDDHISGTLKYCGGNPEQAASLLGISVDELRKHISDTEH
jgi:DNA-binding NtrC family response regulator